MIVTLVKSLQNYYKLKKDKLTLGNREDRRDDESTRHFSGGVEVEADGERNRIEGMRSMR